MIIDYWLSDVVLMWLGDAVEKIDLKYNVVEKIDMKQPITITVLYGPWWFRLVKEVP